MDYTTFYAKWLRFWYTKTGAPHFINAAAISLLPAPSRPVERQFDGFRMLLNPHDLLQANLLLDGMWDESVGYWLRKTSDGAQCVMDIGAHVGYFTMIAWSGAPQAAHIYAFEPNPASRHQLELNRDANNAGGISVIPMALGAAEGTITLYPLNPWEPGATSGFRRYAWKNGFEVQVVALDDFCNQYAIERVDTVKMDTEGAEPLIFKGMQTGLNKGRYPAMIVAMHPHLWENPAETEAEFRGLERLGYCLFRIDQDKARRMNNSPFRDEDVLIVHRDRLGPLGLA